MLTTPTREGVSIEIRDVPAQPCLYIPGKKSMRDIRWFLSGAYSRLYTYAMARTQPKECFARFLSWDKPEIELEAGIVLPEKLPGETDMLVGQFGGHRALYLLHTGSYDKIGEAYEAIQKHLAEHHLKTIGAPYEVYLNSPETVPETDLQTGVYWPIE